MPVFDRYWIKEVFVEVVNVLDEAVLERGANTDIIED
jgi:hypothetical protein